MAVSLSSLTCRTATLVSACRDVSPKRGRYVTIRLSPEQRLNS
jgi:hypothetical protein